MSKLFGGGTTSVLSPKNTNKSDNPAESSFVVEDDLGVSENTIKNPFL